MRMTDCKVGLGKAFLLSQERGGGGQTSRRTSDSAGRPLIEPSCRVHSTRSRREKDHPGKKVKIRREGGTVKEA